MRGVKTIIFLFLLWLVITQGFSWLAFNRLRITEPDKKDCSLLVGCQRFNPHPLEFLEMHARQDSSWYLSIVHEGYSFSKDKQSNVSFFPLYPLMVTYGNDLLKPITPNLSPHYRHLLSGTLISIVSVFLALIMLYKLFLLDVNSKTAFLAIFLLLIFPTSYFFTAIYTESLFLLLAVSTLYFARKNQFILAGLAGYFASLTRPVGIFLVIPVAIELIRKKGKLSRKNFLLNSSSLITIPLGLATFMSYLNQQLGNPFLFLEAAQKWGRNFVLSSNFLSDMILSLTQYFGRELSFTQASSANILIELIFLTFGLILSVLVLKKERISYGAWCLVSVLFPLTGGILVSQGRYTLVLFPIFLTLARLLEKGFLLYHVYLLASLLLLGLLTVLFVNGYWSF